MPCSNAVTYTRQWAREPAQIPGAVLPRQLFPPHNQKFPLQIYTLVHVKSAVNFVAGNSVFSARNPFLATVFVS